MVVVRIMLCGFLRWVHWQQLPDVSCPPPPLRLQCRLSFSAKNAEKLGCTVKIVHYYILTLQSACAQQTAALSPSLDAARPLLYALQRNSLVFASHVSAASKKSNNAIGQHSLLYYKYCCEPGLANSLLSATKKKEHKPPPLPPNAHQSPKQSDSRALVFLRMTTVIVVSITRAWRTSLDKKTHTAWYCLVQGHASVFQK